MRSCPGRLLLVPRARQRIQRSGNYGRNLQATVEDGILRLSQVVRGTLLFLLASAVTLGLPTETTAAARADAASERPWLQDHAVVAVTVDGQVHTLDAWTGYVRGVFTDSGGPLVSSSTTIDTTLRGGTHEEANDDDTSSNSSGADDSRSPPRRHALREGFVVPGLDGVIYSLDTDGRLSVLMSSAPDLVLGPRMACLAVSEDSDGIVEDESCGLLIGEKTTELFSLDTETGYTKRVGEGSVRGSREGGGTRPEMMDVRSEQEWAWGQEESSTVDKNSNSRNQLLLQRDEYVVRALDTATSEELWFVTVAHFSALDLEGSGGASSGNGPSGTKRASVAAADHTGSIGSVQAGTNGLAHDEHRAFEILPLPESSTYEDHEEESWSGRDCDWGANVGITGEPWEHEGGPLPQGSSHDGIDSRSWSERQQRALRGKFGDAHVDRFPYLMYEDNAWVVAVDPVDGSTLWRRKMPTLAVSLYGIRGREWVDVLPPPMSVMETPQGSRRGFGAVMHTPMLENRLEGQEVVWSRDPGEPLMLLPDDTDVRGNDGGVDGASAMIEVRPVLDASNCDDLTGCSDSKQRPLSDGSQPEDVDDPARALVPSSPSPSEPPKMSGLLQPGLRQGQLQAQLGFLNSHFYVSSALRRGPLHAAAAAEDANNAIISDRCLHPVGMANRRSFVDTAGRDVRTSGGVATAFTDDTPPLPPPVAKLPPHAPRPGEQPVVGLAAGGGKGRQRVLMGKEKWIRSTGGGSVRDGNEGSGKTKIGMSDWGQESLNHLELRLQEAKNSVVVEVHPDKEGLYMTWGFIACLVGLVTVIVATVAFIAYKYGTEAMVNMSNITRKRSLSVRLSRTNSTVRSTALMEPQVEARSSHHNPSLVRTKAHPLHPLPHQNGTTANSKPNSTSSIWAPTVRDGNASPPGFLRKRSSRDVQIQRVHSLPALSESHSPATPRDRNKLWKTLFGTEGKAGSDGTLMSSKSDGVAEVAQVAEQGTGVSSSRGDTRTDVETSSQGSPGTGPRNNEADDRTSTSGSSRSRRNTVRRCSLDSSGSSSLSSSAESSPSITSRERSGGRNSANEASGTASVTSTGSPSDRRSSTRRGSKRRSHGQLSREGRQRSGRWRDEGQGSGRSARSRQSEESGGTDNPSGCNDDSGRGRGDQGWRERKGSRSPRPAVVEQAMVLRREADACGPIGLGSGGDAPGALLVTNRRLRTEFVEGEKLGKGGFGTVYKCRNKLDGHEYAIKKIRLSSDRRWQQHLAKVLREVKILALLDHPNIVRYYQAWLERFEDEDEQDLRAQASVSVNDTDGTSAWGPTTGGTHTSHAHGGETATNKCHFGMNGFYTGTCWEGESSHDGIHNPDPESSWSFLHGGGPLQRSNANIGQWPGSSPSPPPPLPCGRPKRHSEDLSIDGWSVDSRNMDDRGASWIGGGGGRRRGAGGGGRGSSRRSNRRFCDFDADDDDYDEGIEDEEDEDEEDASVPGFVFDRAGDEEEENTNQVAGVDTQRGARSRDFSSDLGEPESYREQTGDSEGEDGDEVHVREPSSAAKPTSALAAKRVPREDVAAGAEMVIDNSSPRGEPGGSLTKCVKDDSENDVDRSTEDLEERAEGYGDGRDANTNQKHVARPSPNVMNGHHRGVSLEAGEMASTAAAARGDGADLKHRPRGESWPLNPSTGQVEASRPAGARKLQAEQARSRATAGFPENARRRDWRKGTWGDRRRPRAGKEVYDLWLYIQMQFCSQNNLQYYLEESPDRRAQTRVDMPKVMNIFLQVAKGLQYVHTCGLIHRDLKPANCFFMADGTVKIGDFGLSRQILPAHGEDDGAKPDSDDVPPEEFLEGRKMADQLSGAEGDEASFTGGVGTYLYGSPEQMSGKGYDEKTDIYSLGMLLFEMCHPPFGTKMERTVVLTNAHRLIFPSADVWGPLKGQEAIENLCRTMLQKESHTRPSAAEIVRQVELMQGKHMLLQLDKKPPISYPGDEGGGPDVAVVLRVEALDKEGLLHRLVDLIRSLCRGSHGDGADAEKSGARLEQYGLRGHTGSTVMEFLIAGASLGEREAIIAALEDLEEVHSVHEFPANS